MWADVDRINSGVEPVEKFLARGGWERVVPIICGILENTNHYELSVDVPNQGHISNLPDGPVVEVPGIVSASGIRGLAMGPLPEGIAALCLTQTHLQEMAVEAAVQGDRDLALQCLILDPVVPNPKAAKAIFDELMEKHRAYLPQFE